MADCIVGGLDAIDAGATQVGVSAEAFYDLRHRIIWETMLEMSRHRQAVNIATLNHQLTVGGLGDKVGGIEFLSSLATQSTGATDYWVAEMIRTRRLRVALKVAAEASEEIHDPSADADEIIDRMANRLFALSADTTKPARTILDAIQSVQERIDAMRKGAPQMMGPSTGFHMLDQILCGFAPEQYIALAARPGMGKSLLAGQFAEYWALELGIAVGVFSLEMSVDALVTRWLFSQAKADLQKYRSGYVSNQDVPALAAASVRLAATDAKKLLFVDDTNGLNVEQLTMRMRQMHRKGARLFIIDYLQLLGGHRGRNSNQNRVDELGEVSRQINAMKNELKVPIIVLCQMNRNIEAHEQKNRLPVLADIKDSGQIEQDADVVMFLHEPNLKEGLTDPTSDLGAKQTRFLDSKTSELFPSDWKIKQLSPEDVQEKRQKWNRHLRRVDLLVAKQRNGPSGVKAEMVVPMKWLRFYDAYTPVPLATKEPRSE